MGVRPPYQNPSPIMAKICDFHTLFMTKILNFCTLFVNYLSSNQ